MPLVFVRLLLRILPASQAVAILRRLARRVQRPAINDAQRAAMNLATKMHYGERRNVAWSWGHGPLIVLTHGWGGRAAQLAPLAASIARQGFRCVAVDVTGHGDSCGDQTSWRCFIDDIADVSATVGEDVFAYIGHSAGGLATMAARSIKGIDAKCFVCICSPSYPFPPIRAIQQNLNPPPRVLDAYRDYIAAQFENSWSRLEAGHAFAGAHNLLLFYDEQDRFVDHNEGDRILSISPRARLIKTAANGHTRVLAAPELQSAVVEFLAAHTGGAPLELARASTSDRIV